MHQSANQNISIQAIIIILVIKVSESSQARHTGRKNGVELSDGTAKGGLVTLLTFLLRGIVTLLV